MQHVICLSIFSIVKLSIFQRLNLFLHSFKKKMKKRKKKLVLHLVNHHFLVKMKFVRSVVDLEKKLKETKILGSVWFLKSIKEIKKIIKKIIFYTIIIYFLFVIIHNRNFYTKSS